MGDAFRRLRGDDGQDLVEYALLAAIISVVCMVGMESIAAAIETLFTFISDALRNA